MSAILPFISCQKRTLQQLRVSFFTEGLKLIVNMRVRLPNDPNEIDMSCHIVKVADVAAHRVEHFPILGQKGVLVEAPLVESAVGLAGKSCTIDVLVQAACWGTHASCAKLLLVLSSTVDCRLY